MASKLRVMDLHVGNDHVHVIENAVTEEDVRDQGVVTENTEKEVGIEIENVIENVIVKEKEIVIVTENVIIVNHIHGRDHEAEREIVNVKEIANIENEAEKKVRHVSQPGQE